MQKIYLAVNPLLHAQFFSQLLKMQQQVTWSSASVLRLFSGADHIIMASVREVFGEFSEFYSHSKNIPTLSYLGSCSSHLKSSKWLFFCCVLFCLVFFLKEFVLHSSEAESEKRPGSVSARL